MYIYTYLYTYIYMCIYIYIYKSFEHWTTQLKTFSLPFPCLSYLDTLLRLPSLAYSAKDSFKHFLQVLLELPS